MPRARPPSTYVKTCNGCKKQFHRTKANQTSFRKRKYCSHLCYSTQRAGKSSIQYPVIPCLECKNPIEFRFKESRFSALKRKFCGRSCSDKHNRGVNNSRWNPDRYHPRGNYIFIFADGKWKPKHRVIAEGAIGRKLTRTETVHHVDGNKRNNDNANLVICNNSYHKWLHEEMSRRYQTQHFGPQSAHANFYRSVSWRASTADFTLEVTPLP